MSTIPSLRRCGGRAGPRGRSVPRTTAAHLALLLGLLGSPAACASAQGEPPPRQAPDRAAPDTLLAPPPFRAEPGTPTAWVEGGIDASPGERPVVRVQGRGEVEVAPDRVRVSFAVETEADSAEEAARANAEAMTRAMEGIREAGGDLPGFRIETTGYSLSPRYRSIRDAPGREIVGYTARNHVRVTVDEVDAAGRLIDAALASGANRVAGLQFLIRDSEPHRAEALREAVRRARAEAEVIAESLGLVLGDPVAVEGGAEVDRPRVAAAAFRLEADAPPPPTPVEAGALTVSASVTIRFALERER